MKQFLMVAVLMGASAAFAEDAQGGGKNQRTQVINFEDDTIEGDLTKPDGEYIETTKRVKHSNLIKVRDEFKDKVMQSVDEL